MIKLRRYKLLLDENISPRNKLSITNNYHDLKHIRHDYNYQGYTDFFVYHFARKQKRLIVTVNVKDFEQLLDLHKNKDTGIIGISSNLNTESIDKKLCSLLNKKTPGKLYGKINLITGETGKN